MTPASQAKAVRLLTEGRVRPELAPTWLFHVEGDHGRYVTVVGAHVAICTCPSATRCTHIEACVTRVNADPETLATLDEAIAQRDRVKAVEAEDLFARLGA